MFDLMPFDNKQNSLFRYFDNFEKNFFGDMMGDFSAFRTDIMDKGEKYVLEAELPGFDKNDIQLDIDGDQLTIRASHKEEHEKKEHHFVRRERKYGSFSRSFDVSNIKTDGITANYKNGVLILDLPKKAVVESQTRQIEIQ